MAWYNRRPKPEYNTSYPEKLVEGMTINRVKVVTIHMEHSHCFDQTHHLSPNELEHMTGEVDCECQVCGKLFTTNRRRLNPNNHRRSMWSCGCQRRPQGTGWRAKGEPMGRRPIDMTDERFGDLEPVSYLGLGHWLCFCHRCGNTDGVIVQRTLLVMHLVDACETCKPWQWGVRKADGKFAVVPVPRGLPLVAQPDERTTKDKEPDTESPQEVHVVVDWDQALVNFKRWQEESKERGREFTF